MKKSSFYIPPGYVATRCELVFMFMGCLLMFWLGFRMWDALIEIPAVPEKLVLRSAYVTRLLNVSKAKKVYILMWRAIEGSTAIRLSFLMPILAS